MTILKKYSWEVTHFSTMAVAITTLALVIHFTDAPGVETRSAANGTAPAPLIVPFPNVFTEQSDPAAAYRADPRGIVVGPPEISNRYTLLRVDRKPISHTTDEVTVKLHVESLATDPLVSPFASDMLQLIDQDFEMFSPKVSFRHPVKSGSSLDQNVVFSLSRGMSLYGASLQIHYANYQAKIPLDAAVQSRSP